MPYSAVPHAAPAVVVMGVSGSGKSTLAAAVGTAVGWTVVEGDDFHSNANRAKMHAGLPLTDDDRQAWLVALGAELQRHPAPVLLTCSALKRAYRQRLRDARPGVRFVFLAVTPELAAARVQARGAQHFFPPALVASQFAALEPPVDEADVLTLDASQPLATLSDAVVSWIAHDTGARA